VLFGRHEFRANPTAGRPLPWGQNKTQFPSALAPDAFTTLPHTS
jgi:hypothetical protein